MLSKKLFVVSLLTYEQQRLRTPTVQEHQPVDLHPPDAHTIILGKISH